MMTLTREAIDAALIPESMPSDTEILRGLVEHCTPNAPFGIVSALSSFAVANFTEVDDRGRNLYEAFADKSGHCFTRTAFTVLAARAKPGISAVPAVRSTLEHNGHTKHHAYAFVTDAEDKIHVVDGRRVAPLDWMSPEDAAVFLKKRPELLNGNTVTQIRYNNAFTAVAKLSGAETTQRSGEDVRTIDTLFTGVNGLRSFLTLIEVDAARRRGQRYPVPEGVVIPRLNIRGVILGK